MKNLFEINDFVDDLIDKGKSIEEIIDELANKKCYYTLVEMVLVKKKLGSDEDVISKIKSHQYYSNESDVENPFIKQFIKMIKKK